MPYPNSVSLTSSATPTLETQFEQSNIFANTYQCNNPKWQSFINGQYRPCRQCYNCRNYKKYQWEKRIIRESAKWARSFFVTLTYRNIDDHSYRTLQLYLKRVRRALPHSIRYVATTEYESKGIRTDNPHHHLIIFGPHNLQTRQLTLKWKYGLTQAKLLRGINSTQRLHTGDGTRKNRNPARYLAKYIIKQGERVRASNGIGNNSDPLYPPF